MNPRIPTAILNAARLVRSGNVLEATRMLRETLRSPARKHDTPRSDADPEALEGSFRVVDAPSYRAPEARFLTSSYSNAAGTMDYKIYVPASHGDEPLPLIVMLHGCKQAPDDFAAGTQMNVLAEQHGFIAAYPKQAAKANPLKCWNWFQPEHQQRQRGEPSLIAGITRRILEEFGADARRVYVAGLSAGGAMASVMAATYPELYAAVGIHSGLAAGSALDVASAFSAMRNGNARSCRRHEHHEAGARRPVPAIVFHGDGDDTVHPRNADALVAAALGADFEAGAGALERIVKHGRAAGRDYTRVGYRDADGTTWVEQWTVHGARHAWSGGSADGSFADMAGPNASREMLRFFLQHACEEAK
jgi:poly(hydroxyalkanoate) depolymerase family esterase